MPVNKVVINTENGAKTLIDLTSDSVVPEAIAEGVTAHDASGAEITGTFSLTEEMSEQDNLISQIKIALQGKASTNGSVVVPTQEKTVDINKNGTTNIFPDSGYTLSKVTANVNVPIPEGYIVPSGTKDITSNGTHDITENASVSVNVPIPEGYIVPSGSLEVTENGQYDVTEKESVSVVVPEKVPTLQEKTVTPTKSQKEVAADNGFDGLSKVNVEAIPEQYVIPSGTIDITSNGVHDVSEYASVNVSISGGSTEPDYHNLYQRVEYIESAEEGTYPYIVTDFIVDNTCGAEVVASFPILQDRIPLGSREDSGTTRFYVVYPMSASSIYYGFNTGSTVSCALKVNTIYRLQTNFMNSRLVNVYDENGIRKGGASISATLAPHSVPVSIFGYHSASSGNVTSKREFKLYSARCSRGHDIVRDYIPCYRKSDGVVGLYERITGQFLTNAESGSFAKGSDIDW